MPYQPSLDGLRALAVIAVIFYHGGFTWMPGGFFGVEVFFVVSGFLITTLLVDERERTRSTDLPQFWLRRARRLLPALFVMLAVVATWTMLAGSTEHRSQLRRDLPWSILYAGNWGQILGDIPYYSGSPSPLRHLWSLGVEEQWYVVWPVVFVGLGALPLGRRSRAVLIGVLAFVSMMLSFWLHAGGPGPIGSVISGLDGVDRVNFMYLSTLTRSSGLLLGAAAAFVWRPWRWMGTLSPSPDGTAPRPIVNRPVLDAAGGAAIGGLVVIACSAVLVEGYVFQWLLAVVSLLSLVVVMAAVHPGATWLRVGLSQRALVEVGKRSYGLYLWHWPIFVFADAHDGSVTRFLVAMAIAVVVSELCYRFVENPIRRGALGRFWSRADDRWRTVPFAVTGAAALGLGVFYMSVVPFDRAAGGQDAVFQLSGSGPTTTSAGADPVPPGSSATGSAVVTSVAPTSTTLVLPRRVVIVGDSQAHSLAINQPDGIEDTFDVSDGSLPGCSVYDGGEARSTTVDFTLSFAQCRGWQDDWADAARTADAQVALVVLGAWDVFDLVTPDDEVLVFGTPDWDDYVTAQLRAGMNALEAAGVPRIALLEVPCMRPIVVPGSGVRALPDRADDGRVAHVNELWRAVADEDPAVTFVAGPTEWCTDETISTDVGYRWDGVHPLEPGVNLVFETIAPELLAL